MATEYSKKVAKRIIEKADKLEKDSVYLNSRKQRESLADFYKEIINVGYSLPQRKMKMNNAIAKKLYKRISESCPACVKKKNMQNYIHQAKLHITEYANILEKWLDDTDVSGLPDDVHQLGPTV